MTGISRKKTPIAQFADNVIGDAKDETFVRKVVGDNKYDAVINCIGILNQYAEEDRASAVYLNSFFPHYLAKITEKTNTQIIHISTDCVFSGSKGQYIESDFRDGVTFYDRTKALGELEDSKNLTFRQSLVGPDIDPMGIGLMNWFLQQKEYVEGYTGAIWTGVTTLELAKIIEKASLEKEHGLYNMVPDKSISKYRLLKLFNKYLREDRVQINPVDKMAANKSLKRTRWDFDYIVPSYETMLQELAEWMGKHKELYSHYDLKLEKKNVVESKALGGFGCE